MSTRFCPFCNKNLIDYNEICCDKCCPEVVTKPPRGKFPITFSRPSTDERRILGNTLIAQAWLSSKTPVYHLAHKDHFLRIDTPTPNSECSTYRHRGLQYEITFPLYIADIAVHADTRGILAITGGTYKKNDPDVDLIKMCNKQQLDEIRVALHAYYQNLDNLWQMSELGERTVAALDKLSEIINDKEE